MAVSGGPLTARILVMLRLFAFQLSFAWDPPETLDGLMRMAPRKPGTLSLSSDFFFATL